LRIARSRAWTKITANVEILDPKGLDSAAKSRVAYPRTTQVDGYTRVQALGSRLLAPISSWRLPSDIAIPTIGRVAIVPTIWWRVAATIEVIQLGAVRSEVEILRGAHAWGQEAVNAFEGQISFRRRKAHHSRHDPRFSFPD